MAKTKVKPEVKIPDAATQKAAISGAALRVMQQQRKNLKLPGRTIRPDNKLKEKFILSDEMLSLTIIVDPLNIYKANLGFLRLSRPDFFEFIDNVFSCMTGNINFVAPEPTIPSIQTEVGLYSTAKALKQTAVANTHFGNIKYMMKQLAIYVANNCGNDFDKFTSSGFIANKLKPGPMKSIARAVIREVRDTLKSGEAIAIVNAVPGANFYKGFWGKADDPTSVLTPTRGGKGTKVKFKGLPTDQKLNLFVIASGPLEDGDMSNPYPYQPR